MTTRINLDHAAIQRLTAGPAVVEHLSRQAERVASAARSLAPHRSGTLAASIQVERLSGLPVGFAVGSHLPYTLYVERRSPYLAPALQVLR